jgi:hypothetical protein
MDALSIRLALAKQQRGRRGRALHAPGRAAVGFFAAALSIGGVSEVLQSAPFAVRKDLDRVQVVRKAESGEKLVADVTHSFAANSLYKVARALPDRFVTEERRLFDSEWLSVGTVMPDIAEETHEGISIINDEIREQFFASTIPFGDLIHEKARKYDVDPALVAAVIEQESRFKSRARSHRGALGLMQLMPRTGRWMGASNLYDPEQNVDAGVKYIKYLQKRFNGDLKKTIAAYNAGEGTVRRYGGKVPPYRETRTYVKKVMGNYERRKKELKKYEASAIAESSRAESAFESR